MIDTHRPRIRDESFEDTVKRQKRWDSLFRGLTRLQGQEMHLDRVIFPTSRFAYPKDPKDGEWARRCIAVDEAMSAFWADADRQLRQRAGQTLFDLVQSIIRPHIGTRIE